MKRGAELAKRNKRLCTIVKDGGKVKGWTGKISSLDANSDGLGVVEIEIAEDVHVSTWNNALSDYADHTLIQPGRLLDRFLKMKEGQLVTFDGRFVSSESCVNDSRLTLSGKLEDPDFVFRFSAASPG